MKVSKLLFLCLTSVISIGTRYVSASDSSSTCYSHCCNNCVVRSTMELPMRPLTPKSVEIAELINVRMVEKWLA